MLKKYLFTLVIIQLAASVSNAQVPQLVNYQGILTDAAGIPISASRRIEFSIYNLPTDPIGTALWSETHPIVNVTDGLFNVLLGSSVPIPYSVFDGSDKYLALKVETDPEMTPRKRLVSVGYSFRAYDADKVDGKHASELGADNLGNHRATQNIELNGHWLSGDGEGEGVYVTNAGNVGIGTTSPSEKLTVMGTIYSKSTGSGSLDTSSGVYGEHSIGNYGRLGTNFKGGVYGFGDKNSLGVDVSGVQGEHSSGGIGSLGHSYSGVFGRHGSSGNRGYVGTSDYGVYGENNNGNKGYLGSLLYGVYGEHSSGNYGWIGTSAGGVLGAHSNGNYGHLGSNNEGAYGRHSSGNFGIVGNPDIGVKGVHSSGNYGYMGSNDYGVFARAVVVGATGLYAKGGSGGYAAIFDGTTKTSILEITGGSDLSEQFEIHGTTGEVSVLPGMVVSINPESPGGLIVSNKAYDRRVAGIISGAGGINPGMLMGQKGSEADGSNPVALTGRVYCWADASNGSIQPGDLLTTSDTPGHAMKVSDYTKAQGAIVGKAMISLKEGRGLVLVLVSLQ